MTLSDKDILKIAKMVAEISKATDLVDKAEDTPKVAGKPKKVLSAKERPEILKKLSLKEKREIWGEVNKNNLFGNRYKAAHSFYKAQNVEGRPNIRYSEAFEHLIIPIAKGSKYTPKQIGELKALAISQLSDKIAKQNHPKALEWLNKSLEEIKGLKV
jgi:hypothetical protein